ncbi:MAG: hypothetical protein RLZZ426_1276, partial [Actinomycetota bacterium]
AVSILSPAHAASSQGGTAGRIFTSNMSHGAVYTGDFATPVGVETIFWQEAGSEVDSVASTLTRIAWSGDQGGVPDSSALKNKVLIADVALTAGAITEVSFTAGISALTSDPANERFYATVGAELWAFDSDGTDKTLVYTAQNDEFADIGWGLAVDGVNHKAYIGSGSYLYSLDLGSNNVTGSNLVELYIEFGGIDGVAVDAPNNHIYLANYDGEPGIFRANLDGSGSKTTLFATVPVEGGADGVAPSGVILNSQLGKMYFTVEQGVYESNLDGTGLRNLYYRGQTSSGYETIAIAFGTFNFGGITNPTVTTVSPASGTVDGGTTVTITGTGFQAGATVLIGGVACTVVTRTATEITCTTGAHAAGLVNVVVTNTDTGTVTKNNAYTYVPNGVNNSTNPVITTVSPASGPTAGGTTVTINGTGFKKGAVVTIGGVQCKVLIRVPTKITCKTGAHVAGLVDVVVTNTDTGTVTKNNAFTFIAPAASGTKTIKKTVYFASSSSKLSAQAAKTLRDFAALVPAGATNIKIKIVGFVQPSPDKANDGILSLARAKSIRVALGKAGVNGAWIVSGEGRATGDPVKARRGSVVITYTVVPA